MEITLCPTPIRCCLRCPPYNGSNRGKAVTWEFCKVISSSPCLASHYPLLSPYPRQHPGLDRVAAMSHAVNTCYPNVNCRPLTASHNPNMVRSTAAQCYTNSLAPGPRPHTARTSSLGPTKIAYMDTFFQLKKKTLTMAVQLSRNQLGQSEKPVSKSGAIGYVAGWGGSGVLADSITNCLRTA
jgi:hypothetical protein